MLTMKPIDRPVCRPRRKEDYCSLSTWPHSSFREVWAVLEEFGDVKVLPLFLEKEQALKTGGLKRHTTSWFLYANVDIKRRGSGNRNVVRVSQLWRRKKKKMLDTIGLHCLDLRGWIYELTWSVDASPAPVVREDLHAQFLHGAAVISLIDIIHAWYLPRCPPPPTPPHKPPPPSLHGGNLGHNKAL